MTNLIKKVAASIIIILATQLSATAAPLTYHADFTLGVGGGAPALDGATLSFDLMFDDPLTYGLNGAAVALSNKLTITGSTGLDGMYVDADPTVGVTLDGGSIFLERFGTSSLEYSVGGSTLEATLELDVGSITPTVGDFLQAEHFDGTPDFLVLWLVTNNDSEWESGAGISSLTSIASGGPTDGSGNPPTPMPEPGSLALLVLGLLGMMVLCRTRNKFIS